MARNMKDMAESQVISHGFGVFDQDGDGQISLDDLRSFMESIGEKLSEAQLQEIISEIDTNGSNSISYEEFQETIERKNH